MIAFQADVDVRTELAANAQGWSTPVAIMMSRQASISLLSPPRTAMIEHFSGV
ncbi:hypothetical protein AB0C42_16390 [Micromonospora taraxaci]|uniref:hypothetical protein n=1 Tax=Micromonospora taraxaci TaxID=1316803 RepID=UPI0033C85814